MNPKIIWALFYLLSTILICAYITYVIDTYTAKEGGSCSDEFKRI